MATIHRYQCTIINFCASSLKNNSEDYSRIKSNATEMEKNELKNGSLKCVSLRLYYLHEHKDGYDEDGEHQLQREEAEDLADKAPPDDDVLEVAYKFIVLLLRQHVSSTLFPHPSLIQFQILPFSLRYHLISHCDGVGPL